ncbi:MAG: hypothetical protein HYU66_19010 [Armatimonadetes bacterium]|nr:hypothetical protein [Armatimonadota bacterium]
MTPQQLQIVRHLGYEWWMFRAMRALLPMTGSDADPVRNAAIESLAIHGRAIIDFFYLERTRADDWRAWDLDTTITPANQRAAMPQCLSNWHTLTSKLTAHMTNARASGVELSDLEDVYKALKSQIETLKASLGAGFAAAWQGDAATTSALIQAASGTASTSSPGLGTLSP